jgi:hypothetical protein
VKGCKNDCKQTCAAVVVVWYCCAGGVATAQALGVERAFLENFRYFLKIFGVL